MKQDDIYLTNGLVVRVRYRSFNSRQSVFSYYSSDNPNNQHELISISVEQIVMVVSNSDTNLCKGEEPDVVVECE